jgi:hypothetical protein
MTWRVKYSATVQREEEREAVDGEEDVDILIGADGARGAVADSFHFQKKREGGRNRMIGVTCNFVNLQTRDERLLREFSLVSYLNQGRFQHLEETTGIALENLVFFRDQHFYFVMAPKIHSLVSRGVLLSGEGTPETLLQPSNVCREKLEALGRDIAQFFGVPSSNDYLRISGRSDIDIFDFSTKMACTQSFRIVPPSSSSSSAPSSLPSLFVGIVGDALIEPFWPLGTGTNRAVHSAFDVTWLARSHCLQLARNEERKEEEEEAELPKEEEEENIEQAGADMLRVLLNVDESLLRHPVVKHSLNPATRYLRLPQSYLGPSCPFPVSS